MQRDRVTANHARITETITMIDMMLLIAALILLATVVLLAGYLRQLRRAKKEYEVAKGAVEDIVVSFKGQFKRTSERLETLAFKVEACASRSENAISRSEEIEKQLHSSDEQLTAVLRSCAELQERLGGLDQRLHMTVTSQEAMATKVTSLEEQARQPTPLLEATPQAVIPIRREKALAPLTETELTVLEWLANEGPKTAPEIKERVKLSREHTARLMKKLYESGYLERDPSKIPFRYSTKKEMERLLRKPASETAT